MLIQSPYNMSDLKAFKDSRGNALKKLSTHINKINRVCAQEVVLGPDESLSSLLLQLDGIFEEVSTTHDTLERVLKNLEKTEKGSYAKNEVVSGKGMVDWIQTANSSCKEASVKLIKLIKEEQGMQEQREQQRRKIEIQQRVNKLIPSIKKARDGLGSGILQDPTTLRSYGDREAADVQVKMKILDKK